MANRNYKVGKGKPPTDTQFKPGQSGNPSGRPRGAKNFSTLLIEALEERVTVTENGERKTVTKMEAMAKQLANKAAAGDLHSIKLLMTTFDAMERRAGAEAAEEPVLEEADHEVMNQLYERFRRWEGDDGEK